MVDSFCFYVHHRLVRNIGGLPRPRSEDMVYDEEREEEIQQMEIKEQRVEEDGTTTLKLAVPAKPGDNLGVITEDEELAEQQGESEVAGKKK